MYIENNNGMRVLYPHDPSNIIRSRKTNNIYEFVFLSKNESMDNYVEEAPLNNNITTIDKINMMRAKKMNDLDTMYKILKDRINKATSMEELGEIEIFK